MDVADLTLAVVPSSTPGDRERALAELCRALTPLVGLTVRGVVSPSYRALADALERDQVQYAWMSPALLVLTAEQIELRPLLSAIRNHRADYASALFVDAASSFDVLIELEGKRIAWVDRSSASGYLCPRLQMSADGHDVDRFFGEELFFGSHAEVVRAVFDGRADIGATYAEQPSTLDGPVTRAGFLDTAPDRFARVLQWTPSIPNDVIAGHGLLAPAGHRIFANAILTLAEREDGRALLMNAFHANNFMTTAATALSPLRTLVQRARARGLLTLM